MEEHLSFCRICAAACGIVVTVDGNEVVRVRGDADHPGSRGYVCSKARGLPAWHHRADRLDQPRVRGDVVGWTTLLDDLGAALTATIAAHGTDAVGLYLATGLAYDAAGQVAAPTWLAAIGSGTFLTAATVDNAPVLVAAELVAGHPMLSPVWDPTSAGLLLLLGTNPVVSHGYGTTLPDPIRHLRDFRAGGGRVWVLDPRHTESAAHADEHLAVRPGSDVAVLAAIAAALLEEGADWPEVRTACRADDVDALRAALAPFTLARAAEAADIPVDGLERLVAAVRSSLGKLAVMCGTGTTMSTDGVIVEWLRWVLLIITGSLDCAGGMRFHDGAGRRLRRLRAHPAAVAASGPSSRPELRRVVHQVPLVALADEIEAGAVRALVITGGNPITAAPEPERMRAALASLDVLAVLDVVESELTALATHVLPAAGQLERADVTMAANLSVRSAVLSTAAVVPPAAARRPAWWIFGSLARRMGVDVLGGVDPDAMTDEDFLRGALARAPVDVETLFAVGSHGVDVPVEVGWVRAAMLADGCWNVAPPELLTRLRDHEAAPTRLVLTPRREMGWSNSICYGGRGDEPLARVHPDDAPRGEHGRAVLHSAHGTVTVTLVADESIRPGVVSMTHGRPGRSAGLLTSSHADVDPLTAMPHTSGVPVTIEAEDSA